jgi:hypothetical protein
MAALLIITVMAISLVVSTGYTAYTIIQASDRVSQVQRSAAQMHRLAALVEANLRSLGHDGVASPPAPVAVAATDGRPASTRLPDWIVPGTRTPWAATYGYCVFAPAPDRVSAAVTARAWPGEGLPGARAYVATAPAAPPDVAAAGIVAAIVAPPVGSQVLPGCAALTMKDGQLTVAEGMAVGIGRGASADLAALAASATVRRFVAPQALGDGTGTTPADAMPLAAALGAWQATHPVTTVLTLAEGRHVVPAAALDALAADGEAGGRAMRLVMKGAGPGTVIAADAAGAALRLPVDSRLENLSADLPVEALPGTRLSLAGTVALASGQGAALKASHADLDVSGTLALDARAGDAIIIDGGEALFRDAQVDALVAGGRSGLVATLGAGVTFSASARRPQLRVRARGAAMAAVRAGGARLILDRTDVALDNTAQFGVILESGALEMTNAVVGGAGSRAASAGVLDLGGSSVSADPSTQVWAGAAGRCAQGTLFLQTPSAARTADAAPGAVSGALFAPAGTSTANRANWTCRN